jgi:hypothetical protein
VQETPPRPHSSEHAKMQAKGQNRKKAEKKGEWEASNISPPPPNQGKGAADNTLRITFVHVRWPPGSPAAHWHDWGWTGGITGLACPGGGAFIGSLKTKRAPGGSACGTGDRPRLLSRTKKNRKSEKKDEWRDRTTVRNQGSGKGQRSKVKIRTKGTSSLKRYARAQVECERGWVSKEVWIL